MLKSLIFEKRSCHKTASLLSSHQADNTFLPLALLAASTFLPFAVLILALKPWTFDLDLFFGWNVIFIKRHLPYHTPGLSVVVFLFILWCFSGNSLTNTCSEVRTSARLYLKRSVQSRKNVDFTRFFKHLRMFIIKAVIHKLLIICWYLSFYLLICFL